MSNWWLSFASVSPQHLVFVVLYSYASDVYDQQVSNSTIRCEICLKDLVEAPLVYGTVGYFTL
jgi:hypothetical protein